MSEEYKYGLGYGGWVRYMKRVRSAERCATLLLDRVGPGSRVLDCGCGPGTIAVGIARKVSPGLVIAVDLEASQLDMGRAIARSEGVENIEFKQASAMGLPFEDNSFDAVYESAMLCHLADPGHVLEEFYRVLKPGGALVTREPVVSAMLRDANSPAAFAKHTFLLKKAIEVTGGDAELGDKMGPLLTKAGFTDLFHKVTLEQAESPEEKALVWSTVPATYQKLGPLAKSMGWADDEAIQQIVSAAQAEPSRADGLFAGVFVESSGLKPA